MNFTDNEIIAFVIRTVFHPGADPAEFFKHKKFFQGNLSLFKEKIISPQEIIQYHSLLHFEGSTTTILHMLAEKTVRGVLI